MYTFLLKLQIFVTSYAFYVASYRCFAGRSRLFLDYLASLYVPDTTFVGVQWAAEDG